MRSMTEIEEMVRPTARSGSQAVPAPDQSRNLRRTMREDGICVLTFDRPGSSANIFDLATLAELRQELDFIAGAPEVAG